VVQFYRGHNADISAAIGEPVGALGWNRQLELKQLPLLAMKHAPNQWNGIQIADYGDARFGSECQQTSLAGEPFTVVASVFCFNMNSLPSDLARTRPKPRLFWLWVMKEWHGLRKPPAKARRDAVRAHSSGYNYISVANGVNRVL
jgi:hypothetical protein